MWFLEGRKWAEKTHLAWPMWSCRIRDDTGQSFLFTLDLNLESCRTLKISCGIVTLTGCAQPDIAEIWKLCEQNP